MRRILLALKADESLMLDYQRGDSLAFEVLYERHKDRLFRFVYQHCGNAAAAEDIAHEAWTTLIRSADRYEARARFTTYLFRLAHSRMVDAFRKQKPDEAFSEDIAEPGSQSLDEEMQQQEHTALVLAAVAALTPDQRDAFLLREADLSYEQIADITGVGIETVKSRLRYATKSIQQTVQGVIDGTQQVRQEA